MSWQACAWAISQRIVTQPSARHMLLCLANYADADGKNAFPSIARLAQDMGRSTRQCQRLLKHCLDEGAIRLGDQRLVSARIERADRRPTVYDLAIDLTERGDTMSPREHPNGVTPMSPREHPHGVTFTA